MTPEEKAAYGREYRAAHREEIRAKDHERYMRNRDKILERNRQRKDEKDAYDKVYRAAHRAEISAYNRAYREAHRDELAAHYKAYREEHREEIAASRALKYREKCAGRPTRKERLDAEMVGARFGRWTVEERDTSGVAKYWCRCDCGTRRSLAASSLKSGRTKSCGCSHWLWGGVTSPTLPDGAIVVRLSEVGRRNMRMVQGEIAVTPDGHAWRSESGVWRRLAEHEEPGKHEGKLYVYLPMPKGMRPLEVPVHQVVAHAFLPAPTTFHESVHVHHINFDGQDNRPENLVYLLPEEHNAVHGGGRSIYDPWGGLAGGMR